jgi:hypothetical protein
MTIQVLDLDHETARMACDGRIGSVVAVSLGPDLRDVGIVSNNCAIVIVPRGNLTLPGLLRSEAAFRGVEYCDIS